MWAKKVVSLMLQREPERLDMTERDKLAEKIARIIDKSPYWSQIYLDISDFILEDRKRIVEPLTTQYPGNEFEVCRKALEDTLRNAGVNQTN